jgi:hypothetical protein
MSTGISTADRVLLVCTESYVSKADSGSGGVGYERLIVTGELVSKVDTDKFLPVVRSMDGRQKIPAFLGPRHWIDFSDDTRYEADLERLVREIHRAPLVLKPPLGSRSFIAVEPIASASTPRPHGYIPRMSRALTMDDQEVLDQLMSHDKDLLLAAASSVHGELLVAESFAGLSVTANGVSFSETGNARSEARVRETITHLTDLDLLSNPGDGSILKVTGKGYRIADFLAT